jgi:FkbM family methyltransferase
MAAKNGNEVFALEPNPKALKCLMYNLNINGVSAHICPFAASNVNGQVKMSYGKTATSQVNSFGYPSKAMTVDSILEGRIPDFIKIDVEGHEANVFEGMRETLKGKPKIIFEAWNKINFLKCLHFLKGYKITQLNRDNYFCVPK